MTETVKIKDGHTISLDWSGVFVTDDSGERVEVDTEKDIVSSGRTFAIPLMGGYETVGPAGEAMFLSSRVGMKISAGGRRFEVKEVS